jgi:gluconokinase
MRNERDPQSMIRLSLDKGCRAAAPGAPLRPTTSSCRLLERVLTGTEHVRVDRPESCMIVVLMGVSGSGKTTVGKLLASQLGWIFYDADDYHPAANVAKMHAGIPLTDEDRKPWLQTLAHLIDEARARGQSIVLACSALKHSYQEYLRHHLDDVKYVCLCGSKELIQQRLAARKGHFMNPALLVSQFETLEPPDDAIQVNVRESPDAIASEIRRNLGL